MEDRTCFFSKSSPQYTIAFGQLAQLHRHSNMRTWGEGQGRELAEFCTVEMHWERPPCWPRCADACGKFHLGKAILLLLLLALLVSLGTSIAKQSQPGFDSTTTAASLEENSPAGATAGGGDLAASGATSCCAGWVVPSVAPECVRDICR